MNLFDILDKIPGDDPVTVVHNLTGEILFFYENAKDILTSIRSNQELQNMDVCELKVDVFRPFGLMIHICEKE